MPRPLEDLARIVSALDHGLELADCEFDAAGMPDGFAG
jgi:hypothetical protein